MTRTDMRELLKLELNARRCERLMEGPPSQGQMLNQLFEGQALIFQALIVLLRDEVPA